MALVCVQGAIAGNVLIPAGGNLQSAFNAAQPGDTITLQAGATYTGNFSLAVNPSAQWITIQSSAMGSLPGGGSRVSAGNASAMAKIVTPNSAAALYVPSGANYYRIQGIEFTPASGIYVQDLIQVGNGGESSVGALPHDIDFDRDYIHGEATNGGKRGVAMNGINITVENSYLSGFFSTWQDTQAIAGWNGPGPFRIYNNYLEAGTETVAFGGAVPAINGLVPSDILIQNNTFYKPLSWRGVMWVKNHFELKNAQRVTLDGNTFENNWVGADQRGFALVFTVRTEVGRVPWAVVNDIKILNNRFKHSAAGVIIVGHDDNPAGSGNSTGYLIQNNSWEDISSNWGGDGRMFQLLGASNVDVNHNTFLQSGYLMVFDAGPSYNVSFNNNIATIGYGIAGNGAGMGTSAWNAYVRGGSIIGNLLVGASSNQYPGGNSFPASLDAVGFANLGGGDFNLSPGSPYRDAGSNLPGASQPGTGSAPATSTVPSGWVNIVSKNSGKCLDVWRASYDAGAPLLQWACWGGDNQKFQFSPVNGGYKITVKHNGMAVDVSGGPSVTWDGASVIQWPYWGGSNEAFSVKSTGDGAFTISPVHSGKCLDISSASKADGASVIQWGCWGGDNQKWTFVPAQ